MKQGGILRPWAVLVWLLIWQLGAMAMDQQILLVSPIAVLIRLGTLAVEPSFWKAVGFSLLRITGGFFLGAAVGTVLAALSARLHRVEELLAPLLLAVKSIPVASFIILSLILFSSRNLSVLISFLMVLPVLYEGVLGGIRAMDKQMLEMAQVFQIPAPRGCATSICLKCYPISGRHVLLPWGCAGNRALLLRSSACLQALLVNGSNRLRFIWIRRISLPGHW